jgi:hypothetical protein
MANQPTIVDLQAPIQNLQQQIAVLQQAQQVAIPNFTDTPQTLGAKDLINQLTKRGSAIFEQRVQCTQ